MVLINRKLKIADKNEKLKTLNVWGDKKSVDIFSKEEISITVPKRIKNLSYSIKYQSPIIPPINSEEPIGEFFKKIKKS